MKLVRYGQPGQEKPGLIDAQGALRDACPAWSPTSAAPRWRLNRWPASPRWMRPRAATRGRPAAPRLPVAGVGKIVCVGLNYADHAAESGLPVPAEPVLFLKPSSSITGPDDDVIIPRGSVRDRLGGRAGRRDRQEASYVEESEALEYVAATWW